MGAVVVTDVDAVTVKVTLTSSPASLLRISLVSATGLTIATGTVSNSNPSVVFTGSVSDVNAALAAVKVSGMPNANGAGQLDIEVGDQGSSGTVAAGVTKATGSNVVAQNDAPTFSTPPATSVSFAEDTSATLSMVVADVDTLETAGTPELKVTISCVAGYFTMGLVPASVAALTTSSFSGGGSALGSFTGAVLQGTVLDLNAALTALQLTGLPDANTGNVAVPAAVTIVVGDLARTGATTGVELTATRTVAVTITRVNDAPTMAVPAAVTLAEEGTATFGPLVLADVDVAETTDELECTLTSVPGTLMSVSVGSAAGLTFSAGSAQLNNNIVPVVMRGTRANLNLALNAVTVSGRADQNTAAVAGSLAYSCRDMGGSGTPGERTVSGSLGVAVTAVNDPPAVTVPGGTVTLNEDLSSTAFAVSFADVDIGAALAGVQLTASASSLFKIKLSSGALTGVTFVAPTTDGSSLLEFTCAQADCNAAMSGLVLTGLASQYGPGTLAVRVDDQGSSGVAGSSVTVVSQTVSVTAINDAPVLTKSPASLIEDTSTAIGLTLSDLDAMASAEVVVEPDLASLGDQRVRLPISAALARLGLATKVVGPAQIVVQYRARVFSQGAQGPVSPGGTLPSVSTLVAGIYDRPHQRGPEGHGLV
jgi:hypothetical protein